MKRDWMLLLLLSAGILLLPNLVKSPYYYSVLIFVAINGIVVLGLTLLMGYAGQISLGHAGFFGLGAYFSMIFTVHLHLNPWAAMALGLLATVLIAYLLGMPTLRLSGHYLAMATLGLGIVLQIIFKEEIDWTGGPSGTSGIPYLKAFGIEFSNDHRFYYLAWIFLLGLFALSINLIHSRTGRALRAISQNQIAAGSLGIPVDRTKLSVFALSAGYASLAGSLYAHYFTFINPSPFGFMASVKLVAMVVVGGSVSLWGALLGAALLTSLPEFLTVLQEYEMVVYGGILILVMMFAPTGLAGIILNIFRRLTSGTEKENAATV
jgi:branched-chain amino acid transport system permease protein